MYRFQGGQRVQQRSDATLQLIMNDLKKYTMKLADILRKYQHYGEKIDLPDDEQERQEFCLHHLHTLTICITEVKVGKNQLESKIDVMRKHYKDSTKMMRTAMAKEVDALKEQIRFFEILGSAQMFVFELEMLTTDIEIELATLENRRRFATKNQRITTKILQRHILHAGVSYVEEKERPTANDKPDEHIDDEKNSKNDGNCVFEAEVTDVLTAIADGSLTLAQVTLSGLPQEACNDISERRHLQKLRSSNKKKEIHKLQPLCVPSKISLTALSISLYSSLDPSTPPFDSRSTERITVFNCGSVQRRPLRDPDKK